jgi:hypothetical protein
MEAVKLLSSIPPQVQQMNIEPFTINYKKMTEMALADALDIKNVREIIVNTPPPPPSPPPGSSPAGSGGGGQVPPDKLLREALKKTAPNPQAAQMVDQIPMEQLMGSMGGGQG